MNLVLQYEVWLIAALLLIALDLMIGFDFILLAIGLSSAATGASLYLKDWLPPAYAQDWESVVIFFALASVAILIPLRLLVRREEKDIDINRY